jgi:hypothetical protein
MVGMPEPMHLFSGSSLAPGVRYERHAENFLGMLQLASSLILLRHL